MKLLIQRVARASVFIKGEEVASIQKGLLVFVGFAQGDGIEVVKRGARKLSLMRLFPEGGKDMNQSVQVAKGEILLVSQFTLLADTQGGNRPSFLEAKEPTLAKELFDLFVQEVSSHDIPVQTGRFGEYMSITLVNDGPVTIVHEEE